MNIRIIVFHIVVLLSLNIVVGQGKDLSPLDLSPQLFGTWLDQSGQVALVITEDYLVLESEIWYYRYINTVDNIKISITCVNKNQTNVFQFFVNNEKQIYFYYNRKDLELVKGNAKIKLIPDSLFGKWISTDGTINIKDENTILYNEEVFVCDYIINNNDSSYKIILYKNGNYYLLEIKNLKGKMVIEALDLTNQRFFKESIFHKYYNWFLSLLSFFVFTLGYLLVRWRLKVIKRKEELKRKIVEIQLKSVRAQMNPHFLFNALSAIQNLINKNENERASHYLTEFSQLMRLTLDKSENGLVSLFDEIESIKKYLDLERLRFKFVFTLKIDTKIDALQIEIPAMLIQPFVENAIVHGLNGNTDNKKLDIEFKKQGNYLHCFIKDNGIGVKASKANRNISVKRKQYGHKLAEDRIDLINKSYNTNAKIIVTDLSENSKNETGTLVEIRMPLNY